MEGVPQIVTPAQGFDDFFAVVNAAFLQQLAALSNAEWKIVLPAGAGSGKVVGSPGPPGSGNGNPGTGGIIIDLSLAKLGGYEQPIQFFMSGQIYDGIALLKAAPIAVTP